MNGDKFAQAFREQQRIKDEAMVHSMRQLAFGSNSAGSILSATTAATNIYATATGVFSCKKEVDDAVLFMDNKLKISAFNMYTLCTDDSMYKFDDTSAISSSYAITEYFNVIYYDALLTPGSKYRYIINDTKNIIKHLNFLTQNKFENIAQNTGAFQIGKIVHKWENLHKALI